MKLFNLYIIMLLIIISNGVFSFKAKNKLKETLGNKGLSQNKLQLFLNRINQNTLINKEISNVDFNNNDNSLLRTEENIKKIAFVFVKAYLENLASNNKNKLDIVSVSNENKDCAEVKAYNKFIFKDNNNNKNEDKGNTSNSFIFRICVPKLKSKKPYLDIFCPYSACLEYTTYLNNNLSCLQELSSTTKNKIKTITNNYLSN